MGEARLRGSLEQRQAEGRVKREIRVAEITEAFAKRIANLTPAQRMTIANMEVIKNSIKNK